jgi:hypothetical protein
MGMGEMGAVWRASGLVGAALVGAAAGLAWAQSDDVVARLEAPAVMRGAGAFSQRSATPAGAKVLLFHYFDVGPDCGATEVTFRLATPPAHGAVTFVASQNRPFEGGRPLFADGDPRARCDDRLVPTRDAVYTPEAGYSGEDSFVIEATEAGTVAQDTVDVSVLSFGKPLRTRYPG